MLEYITTRKRWRLITEKRLERQNKHDRKYYAKWYSQKIILEVGKIRDEKDADINLLNDEIYNLKKELREYKKEVLQYDLDVAKLKNELKEKINVLDAIIGKWNGVPKMILAQIGISESLIDSSEKMLKKGDL